MITNQEKEIERLKKENERLKKIEEKYNDLKKEYEDHKKQCSILDNIKPIPSFVKLNIKHRNKTPGLKKGHKGYFRKSPEIIDYVKKLILDKCPECSNNHLSKVQEIRERIIIDIPEQINPVNTKYKIERRYCSKCRKIVEAEFHDALPNARFGLRLMLLVVFLKIGLAMPSMKIVRLLETQYNIKLSNGEVYKILEQVANAFGPYYKILEQKIKEARVKHIDETSARINGKNHWLWAFITKEIAYYTIRKNRNSKVPIKILQNQKEKIIVSDRFSAYNVLEKISGCLLQVCWSHLLRTTKDLAELYDEAKYIHKRLKNIYKKATALNHNASEKQIRNLYHLIDLVAERKYKHTEVRKFIKSICINHRQDLFRFVTDKEVESTNNRAERSIRPFVIIRKISNCHRSRKGADVMERLLSVIETLKIQGKNPLKEMLNLIQASEN